MAYIELPGTYVIVQSTAYDYIESIIINSAIYLLSYTYRYVHHELFQCLSVCITACVTVCSAAAI